MRHSTRAGIVALLFAALAACTEPAPKPAPPPAEPATPKLGVVALVTEVKEHRMTEENWKDSIKYLFSNERDKNLASVRYEVTVFYDDGTNGIVKLDEKPSLLAGQRVRVTGNKIEVVRK
jgi:hypothetical protein